MRSSFFIMPSLLRMLAQNAENRFMAVLGVSRPAAAEPERQRNGGHRDEAENDADDDEGGQHRLLLVAREELVRTSLFLGGERTDGLGDGRLAAAQIEVERREAHEEERDGAEPENDRVGLEGHGSRSVYLSPQQRQGAVQYHEDEERRQDAGEALTVELPHALFFLHRHKKVGGDNHEQGHCHTRESVVYGHPQAVGFAGKIGLRPCHIRGAGSTIKVLTGMNNNHKETRKHAHVI